MSKEKQNKTQWGGGRKEVKCELYNDNFQNYKRYHIPQKAQYQKVMESDMLKYERQETMYDYVEQLCKEE